MSRSVMTIPVGPASDGTGATPAAASHYRDDGYYLDAIAERWVKEQGRFQNGITYRLAHLPHGYAGYAKARDGSKHVDRYLYGHPNGIFRSMNELYPHFKHLQDHGGSVGCDCKLCSGKKPSSRHSGSPAGSQRAATTRVAKPKKSRPSKGYPASDPDAPSRHKQVDEEGCEDIYRKLLDKLKDAGPERGFGADFIDQASPDWRAGHKQVEQVLVGAQQAPRHQPRLGELVLFDRTASSAEGMAWDPISKALRKFHPDSHKWLSFPKWEAGVVTQIPVEPLSAEDLNQVPPTKKRGVTYSGYRVEPLTPLSTKEKPIASQHKYAPLHAIRPFLFWKECVQDLSQAHATIAHAMKVSSSFSIIGKESFEGHWPEATLYSKGLYIGPELILVGDAVRLNPREGQTDITDVMVVDSIRLRFVNLEEANDDDYDDDHPYHVCLHIRGKSFTLDPKRSFPGQPPVTPGKGGLPEDLAKYGQWYPVLDPAKPASRLEVPFSRIIGKCYDDIAMEAWWSSSQSTNPNYANGKAKVIDLSQGLQTLQEARRMSTQSDPRIDKANGKSWFWAESRIEQLDVHEINDQFVGVRDEERSKAQMHTWRQALKILDGKRSGFDAHHEAHKERQEQEQRELEQSAAFGMMGGAARDDSGEDVDMDGLQLDEDEVDQHLSSLEAGSHQSGGVRDDVSGGAMDVASESDVQEMAPPPRSIPQVVIDVSSDEDELMGE